MDSLDGIRAVVTGATSGLGRAMAEALAAAGARVGVTSRRRDRAEAAAAELGSGVEGFALDVRDEESVAVWTDHVWGHFGGLDVLVSNAALGTPRPALDLKVKHWQKTLDVMGRALLLCAQRAVPLMEGRWGRIIAITSIGSFRVLPNYAGPGAAKAVLETLTRYLAVELAPRGISVNAVSGGVVETDALKSFPNQDDMLAFGKRAPLGRLGQPEDIAAVVTMLCRPEARWICGQTIIADGGYSLLA